MSLNEQQRQTLVQLTATRDLMSFADALDLMPAEGRILASGAGVLYVPGNNPIAMCSAPIRIDDVADITLNAPIPYRARTVNEIALWEKLLASNPRYLSDGHIRAITTQKAMDEYEADMKTKRALDAKEREMIRGFVNGTNVSSSGKFTRMGAKSGDPLGVPAGKPINIG